MRSKSLVPISKSLKLVPTQVSPSERLGHCIVVYLLVFFFFLASAIGADSTSTIATSSASKMVHRLICSCYSFSRIEQEKGVYPCFHAFFSYLLPGVKRTGAYKTRSSSQLGSPE